MPLSLQASKLQIPSPSLSSSFLQRSSFSTLKIPKHPQALKAPALLKTLSIQDLINLFIDPNPTNAFFYILQIFSFVIYRDSPPSNVRTTYLFPARIVPTPTHTPCYVFPFFFLPVVRFQVLVYPSPSHPSLSFSPYTFLVPLALSVSSNLGLTPLHIMHHPYRDYNTYFSFFTIFSSFFLAFITLIPYTYTFQHQLPPTPYFPPPLAPKSHVFRLSFST